MTSTTLGVDGWTNAPRYTDNYRSRINYILSEVPVPALQQLVSSQRNGLECAISGNYSAGDFNLVRKVTFIDSVEWIVRIRLPPLSYFSPGAVENEATGNRRGSRIACTERDLESLKSEIATMKYLRFEFTL